MQTNDQVAQTYNEVPYTSKVFSSCQPTRLHALAKIKGLNPAPLENAKVLEIGCSFGGNLMPFAIRYPNSQIVGIDLAEHQINVGKQMFAKVGINNVELVAADISQVGFNIQFDYIICHGVFSWVPEFVQQAILKVVQQYLAPNGIAYISYNTYPGWKSKDIIRDLMLFGSNENLSSLERVDQGIATLDFVNNILSRDNSARSEVMRSLSRDVKENESKYYIAHEYFETFNQAFYFRQFIKQIEQYNLAYVTDASTPVIFKNSLFATNEEYDQVCQYFNFNLENIEQFLDFLQNRCFRGSIITHQQNKEACGISQHIEQYFLCHHFYDVYLKTSAVFETESENKGSRWVIQGNGAWLKSNELNDELFNFLNKQNQPCKVQDIFDHLKSMPSYDETELQHIIWFIIHLNGTYLCFSPEPNMAYNKKPKLAEKYRHLIQFVQANPNITSLSNRYYQNIGCDYFLSYLAQHLDGTKTIQQLIKQIKADIENDLLLVTLNNVETHSKEIADQEIENLLMQYLTQLQEYGYFNLAR